MVPTNNSNTLSAVDVEGQAQPFESIQQHTKKDVFEIEPRILDNPQLRQKYLSLLNNLCFLARQADEFNTEKARQEKPDLIASNCVETASPAKKKKNTTMRSSPVKNPPPPQIPNEGTKKKPLKRTKRSEGSFIAAGKPPNILIYSESSVIRDNALAALESVLAPDT